MKLEVFSIYDLKAKAFMTPFFMHRPELAVRAFTNLVNDPNTEVSRHPMDFQLFHIGVWDDSVPHLSSMVSPIPLGIAAEFKLASTPLESAVHEAVLQDSPVPN